MRKVQEKLCHALFNNSDRSLSAGSYMVDCQERDNILYMYNVEVAKYRRENGLITLRIQKGHGFGGCISNTVKSMYNAIFEYIGCDSRIHAKDGSDYLSIGNKRHLLHQHDNIDIINHKEVRLYRD